MFKLLFLNLFLVTNTSFANDYFNKDISCIPSSEISFLAEYFPQFKNMQTKEPMNCKGRGLNDKWFKIAKSLLALKTLDQPVITKTIDQFTIQPIQGETFWDYFVQRVSKFNIDSCSRNESAVAYVMTTNKFEVFLCPQFFERPVSGQVETLLHEARHFEGHMHVTCSRGELKNTYGGCDKKIDDGGSYAITVQTLVAMNKSSSLSEDEKILAANEAIFVVNNHFNVPPEVKVENNAYLVTDKGEIFKANTKNIEKLEYVTTLESPAKIYSGNNNFTVFPLNKNKNAYRVDSEFKKKLDNIGSYAKFYNSLSTIDKSSINAINYRGMASGIIKNNELYLDCVSQDATLKKVNTNGIKFTTIFTIKRFLQDIQTIVISDTNQKYVVDCDSNSRSFTLKEFSGSAPYDTDNAFEYSNHELLILDSSGNLSIYNLNNFSKSQNILTHKNWISSTLVIKYSFFN